MRQVLHLAWQMRFLEPPFWPVRQQWIPKLLLRQGPLVLQLLWLALPQSRLVFPHLPLALPPPTLWREPLSSLLRYQRTH